MVVVVVLVGIAMSSGELDPEEKPDEARTIRRSEGVVLICLRPPFVLANR